MNQALRVAICEDHTRDAQRLKKIIAGSGIPAVCEWFDSGEGLLDNFSPGRYDLILLDIYMGGCSGVEAARRIRQQDGRVTLAFATSSPEHTLESYRLGALKYLEKPVCPPEVTEALRLADLKRRHRPVISLLAAGTVQDIPLEDILYMETRDHAVLVHTLAGVVRTSQQVQLSKLARLLPAPPFLRCHRSYIVNLNHVAEVERDFLMLNGDTALIRKGDEKKCARAWRACMLERTWGGDNP